MLVLVVLYSTPINYLHNCRNLNHTHHETSFEATHDHCYLCDLQFQPYFGNSENIELLSDGPVQKPESFYSEITLILNKACKSLRGPPSLA